MTDSLSSLIAAGRFYWRGYGYPEKQGWGLRRQVLFYSLYSAVVIVPSYEILKIIIKYFPALDWQW